MLHRKSTGGYNYFHLLSLGEACIAELESRLGGSASLLGDIFRPGLEDSPGEGNGNPLQAVSVGHS